MHSDKHMCSLAAWVFIGCAQRPQVRHNLNPHTNWWHHTRDVHNDTPHLTRTWANYCWLSGWGHANLEWTVIITSDFNWWSQQTRRYLCSQCSSLLQGCIGGLFGAGGGGVEVSWLLACLGHLLNLITAIKLPGPVFVLISPDLWAVLCTDGSVWRQAGPASSSP